MAAFDVATVITEFIADAERTNIELPHMTTGQRRNAKKLLESYPELRCESYGFGADRRLHLFKKCSDESPQESDKACDLTAPAVNIKNTFIDDWVAPKPESVMFRSLQPHLDKHAPDFASVMKMSSHEELGIAMPNHSVATSSEAIDNPANVGTLADSPAASDRDCVLRVPQEKIQVRNTFIHFEAPADERVVQSMPHGMFKQCILSEASQVATGYDTPSTTGYDTLDTDSEAEPEMVHYTLDETSAGQSAALSVGTLVVVEGLVKAPAFNGRSAVVQGWDEATGRYDILFASSNGSQQAKIKEENLRLVLPCP